MLDSNNTEYKKTDNIKKQQIPKIQTMTFKDGAVAEEGLWISWSLIPLIRLAFSFAIKVAAIYFPNMIYTGGIFDFYITVLLQQLTSSASSTSLYKSSQACVLCHQHHWDWRLVVVGDWTIPVGVDGGGHYQVAVWLDFQNREDLRRFWNAKDKKVTHTLWNTAYCSICLCRRKITNY